MRKTMTPDLDPQLRSTSPKTFKLTGADRKIIESSTPGTLGGHRPNKIYGRLNCASALQALAKGGYAQNRVFFLNESIAIAAGYHSCANI